MTCAKIHTCDRSIDEAALTLGDEFRICNLETKGWDHSVAYDPIAFNKKGSRNNLVITARESEGIYLTTFDMNASRDYRKRETLGNAFRRPHRYAELTSTRINEPFIRFNSDGETYDPTKR